MGAHWENKKRQESTALRDVRRGGLRNKSDGKGGKIREKNVS